jgi:hypothetical protein
MDIIVYIARDGRQHIYTFHTVSGRTQSFVGLEESVTLKIVRQNPPMSE